MEGMDPTSNSTAATEDGDDFVHGPFPLPGKVSTSFFDMGSIDSIR